MPTLLRIDASPREEHSISRKLSAAATAAWKEKHPTGVVIERNLSTTDLTFVDLQWIEGAFSAPEGHTESHKRALALSDLLIEELLTADEVILGTPMYNFNVPAVLKAWIDHVVRAGKTFSISADGLEGLARGRKVVIAVASGSSFVPGSPLESYNHEIPYLRTVLGFIGITDVTVIHAGGTNQIDQGTIPYERFMEPFLKAVTAAI